MSDPFKPSAVLELTVPSGEFRELLAEPTAAPPDGESRVRSSGVLIGRLVGFTDDGTTPLVAFDEDQDSVPLPARAILDLRGSQVGREVVLMFEAGDPGRPIVVGCLHDPHSRSLPDLPGQVEVDVDGKRLVVSAREQLVLRCGKASITLTRAGKVLIRGAYVTNQSSGVLRLKGGSVQIN